MKALVGEVIEPRKKKKVREDRALVVVPENASRIDRRTADLIKDDVKLLDPKRETFEERQERLEGNRVPYASMVAHQEMAAIILASGGTYRLAAAKAGVSVRQVKKYYSSADFRQRIEELRSTRFSKIIGRVLKELDKRTEKGAIEKIELLDLLRVWDRVAGPVGGKGGVNIAITNNQNYDSLIAALTAPVGQGEGEDFQSYGPEDLRLPGGSSPE